MCAYLCTCVCVCVCIYTYIFCYMTGKYIVFLELLTEMYIRPFISIMAEFRILMWHILICLDYVMHKFVFLVSLLHVLLATVTVNIFTCMFQYSHTILSWNISYLVMDCYKCSVLSVLKLTLIWLWNIIERERERESEWGERVCVCVCVCVWVCVCVCVCVCKYIH